ncbi:MAG: hypothetical protein OEQ18_15275, partial [Gammaproteobacteria bacterium]|nr:hypothetical protein [Gammaproteobacteria bacterium]
DPSGMPTVSFSDSSAPGACGDARTITRTWTATDACGNDSAADQIITVADTTPPMLTIPVDVTIACGESTAPGNTGQATGADNCSVQLSFTDQVSTGACPLGSMIVRSWTATDLCGNQVSQDQIITIQDPPPPEVFLAPIVQMDRASTNVTLWSVTTNTWAVQPEYCTRLSCEVGGWTPIPVFDNTLQITTNVTEFVDPAADEPYLFFRIRLIPP